MPKHAKAIPSHKQRKTIHLVDEGLVADMKAAVAKRGMPMLTVAQIVRLALGEWLAAQGK